MTFTELRQQYPIFEFSGIRPEFRRTENGIVLNITYCFSFGEEHFSPHW